MYVVEERDRKKKETREGREHSLLGLSLFVII